MVSPRAWRVSKPLADIPLNFRYIAISFCHRFRVVGTRVGQHGDNDNKDLKVEF